jgi:outer membrane protein assembly factor BamE
MFFPEVLEDIQNPFARMRDLEASLLEVFRFHLNIVSLRLPRDAKTSPKDTMTMRLIFILLTTVLSLGACNLIYKQNVQQGNALEQEDIDELYIGMNRRQVLFVLGTPSVRDPFHEDRWDYVQTFSRRGGPLVQRTVTLMFENDALAEIVGAENPFDTPIEETAGLSDKDPDEVDAEEKERVEKYEKGQEVLDQGAGPEDDF